MVEQKYDKKKLTILRLALIALGAALGFTALWQYFTFYPDVVRPEFKIAITVVSSAATAAILWLSAKAFYNLFGGMTSRIYAATAALGVRGVIAATLGFFAAGVIVYVFDIVICTLQDIWAVRLLTDVLVFMVFAAVCCVGFTKWLDASEQSESAEAKKRGYFLSADCFMSERVMTAADVVIGAKTLDGAYKALLLSDDDGKAEAAARLDALVSSGKVKVIKCNKEFSTAAQYAEIERAFAENKRLKLISQNDGADIMLEKFSLPSDTN